MQRRRQLGIPLPYSSLSKRRTIVPAVDGSAAVSSSDLDSPSPPSSNAPSSQRTFAAARTVAGEKVAAERAHPANQRGERVVDLEEGAGAMTWLEGGVSPTQERRMRRRRGE